MKKILFILSFFIMVLYAEQLSNRYITFSINPQSGTLGGGLDQNAIGLVYDGTEYLNKTGIPFEFFSLKINDKVYANDNAEGYDNGAWPPSGLRENNKNLPTKVFSQRDNIVAVTDINGLARVTHRYRLGNTKIDSLSSDKRIYMDVGIENISGNPLHIKYLRGIDMDPPDINTDNRMGYKKEISAMDLVYTVSAKRLGMYPLSFYSADKVSHEGAILAFDKKKGCLYDPDLILSKSKKHYKGDGVIYMVFDIGELKSGATKRFSLSYYLDNNLEGIVRELKAKNPIVKPNIQLISYRLKHHTKNDSQKTTEKAFQLKATNPLYRQHMDMNKKFKVFVSPEKGKIPDGIALFAGNSEKMVSIGKTKVILPGVYKFGDRIKMYATYGKNWKVKKAQSITFDVGISNEKGKYGELTVEFIPLADDTPIPDLGASGKLSFKVPYGGGVAFDPVAEGSFSVTSKANNGKTSKAKIIQSKDSLVGIQFAVNGEKIGDTSFVYTQGKRIGLQVLRNKEFSSKETKNIDLTFIDLKSNKSFLLPVEIIPVPRKLEIQVSPEHPVTSLDKLEDANATVVLLFDNSQQIRGKAFEESEMEVNCQGLNCDLKKDSENSRYLLFVYPDFIQAFTKTGDIPIMLKLVEAGYPQDHAESRFVYTVKDTGWTKWIDPLIKLLLILALLWYFWGITWGKKRFKKNQVVAYATIHRGVVEKDAEMDYYLRKRVPWIDVLIPYRSQEVFVEELRFVARRNRQIYLSKRSQEYVIHNGMKIDDAGRKDIKLFPGDYLRTDHAQYIIL